MNIILAAYTVNLEDNNTQTIFHSWMRNSKTEKFLLVYFLS